MAKGGGGGNSGNRSGRARTGATTVTRRAGGGAGFTVTDNRNRSNVVRQARASVGARTQRSRTRQF